MAVLVEIPIRLIMPVEPSSGEIEDLVAAAVNVLSSRLPDITGSVIERVESDPADVRIDHVQRRRRRRR